MLSIQLVQGTHFESHQCTTPERAHMLLGSMLVRMGTFASFPWPSWGRRVSIF
jgi:hypothetical protein